MELLVAIALIHSLVSYTVKRRPISEDAVDITDLNPKFIPSLETTTRICDHHRISEEDDESYQDTTTEDEGEIYECVSEEEPDTEEATTVEECTEGEETTTEEMTTEEETTTEDFSTCEDDTTTEEDNTTEDVTTCEDDTTTEDVTTEEETTTEETTTEDVTTEEETTTCEDDSTTEDKLTTKETPRRYDTCKFSGLAYPYFDTFDSQKLEYQGLCRFILAMNHSSTLPGFKVMAVNFAPSFDDVPQADSGKVAYVGRLDVLLGDFEISLRQLQSSPKETVEVYINNVIVDLPHDISPIFDIRRSRSSVRLTTPFGLEVELSSDWQARIVLPEEFKSQVTGFCGNFNENPEDDLMTKEGKLVDGPNAGSEIGDSFIDSEWKDYSCRKRKVGQNAECSEESAEKIREGLERCRAAKEEFSMCSEDIQETIREMVDECEANVRRICSSLSALHLVDIMISIKCWRQPGIQSFPRVTQKPCYCPDPRMICGPSKPTECPRTCLNPEGGQSPEDCPERESLEENECFCPDDYVLHDDVCLKEEECGCVDRERKVVHEEGSTWLNFDCTIKFRCKNGVIREEKFICPRERKCRGGFCIPYF